MYLAYSWIMTAKSAAACHFDFCSTLHARSPRSGRGPQPRAVAGAPAARRFHVRADEEPSFFPDMSYPEKMSAPHLAPDANSIGMAVSPAGAAAVDPDKTNAKPQAFYAIQVNVSPPAAAQKNMKTTRTARRRLARSGPRARVTSSHCVATTRTRRRSRFADS